MKAKCPHCQNGCDRCDGGFTEVEIASGDWYTRHCRACGFENGVRIVGDGLPPLPPKPEDPCVMCRSAEVEWLPLREEKIDGVLENLDLLGE